MLEIILDQQCLQTDTESLLYTLNIACTTLLRQRRIAAIEVMDVAQDAERAARGKWALEAIERLVAFCIMKIRAIISDTMTSSLVYAILPWTTRANSLSLPLLPDDNAMQFYSIQSNRNFSQGKE